MLRQFKSVIVKWHYEVELLGSEAYLLNYNFDNLIISIIETS